MQHDICLVDDDFTFSKNFLDVGYEIIYLLDFC